MTAVANQSLYLTCAASGVPTPLIMWTTTGLRNLTNNDDISINQTTITVNGHVFVVSVLKLCAVMYSDMGDYKCIASNGATVENGISNHISKLSLIVNGKPDKHPLLCIYLYIPACMLATYSYPLLSWCIDFM